MRFEILSKLDILGSDSILVNGWQEGERHDSAENAESRRKVNRGSCTGCLIAVSGIGGQDGEDVVANKGACYCVNRERKTR